jgi:hypothetical protein
VRKQSASSSPASDNFLQSHEQPVELEFVHVDHKNGQSTMETLLSQKRKQPLNLQLERQPSNESARLTFQVPIASLKNRWGGQTKIGSPKEPLVEVKIDQAISKKNMRVRKEKSF